MCLNFCFPAVQGYSKQFLFSDRPVHTGESMQADKRTNRQDQQSQQIPDGAGQAGWANTCASCQTPGSDIRDGCIKRMSAAIRLHELTCFVADL
ncbi:unnamed protein product [Protopolystoma xenopodis]|uniref:Uncharacterized protein n=1 Tax=Protopolystoma xenopodis TaxID=117903 RepID=A0A3S4ZNE2_9PLAT|nr:unnamed protein product [Protopolystoma xenopodis]